MMIVILVYTWPSIDVLLAVLVLIGAADLTLGTLTLTKPTYGSCKHKQA